MFKLQKFMGHTAPKTTQRYAHLNMEGLQKVLDAKEGKVVKLDKKRKDGEIMTEEEDSLKWREKHPTRGKLTPGTNPRLTPEAK
ncbi:MAG: hypothetical protein AB1847_15125 [bacterium]